MYMEVYGMSDVMHASVEKYPAREMLFIQHRLSRSNGTCGQENSLRCFDERPYTANATI